MESRACTCIVRTLKQTIASRVVAQCQVHEHAYMLLLIMSSSSCCIDLAIDISNLTMPAKLARDMVTR